MIHWPRTIKPLMLLAALVGALTLVPSASAGYCGSRAVSQPFAPWGDTNDYFPLRNGGFENGLDSWDALWGGLGFGSNQPWWLNGQRTGYSSVRMFGDSSLGSRSFCASGDENIVRMFVQSPGKRGSWLRVVAHVSYRGSDWDQEIGWFDGGASKGWSLSPPLYLFDAQPGSEHADVSLTFQTGGSGWAGWGIDDVYVDPFRTT